MATSQQFLVCDSSTLVNFKQWAKAISDFFTTAGWVQAADTGQVNWTSIASVPGSGAFVYEIWKPGDALTVFYVKIEYGNVTGTNCPSLRLSLGTGTNGTGTLTGFFFGPVNTDGTSFTAPSTTTQFECNFSGSTSRISAMMWRNGTNSCQQFFAIERSVDSAGAYTGTYATLWTCGNQTGTTTKASQRSLVFAVGVGPNSDYANATFGGFIARANYPAGSTSAAFNGGIPFDLAAPAVGYFDYSCTVAGIAIAADLTSGVTFTATVYGATRTYMPSSNGPFAGCIGTAGAGFSLCMRYD